MDRLWTATAALFLLAWANLARTEGSSNTREYHIAQFRKLNALVSSDASTSQSFGDVVFETSASGPAGEVEAGAAPEPSMEEDTQIPAVSPEDIPEESPAGSPQEAPAESPDDGPAESPESAPEDGPAESPEDAPAESPDDGPAESPEDAPEDGPAESPEDAPEEGPAESPQDAPAAAPVEPPAESPAEAPDASLLPPEEAPAEAPDVIDVLEKDIPELFPAVAPDIEDAPFDRDEFVREQLLNTSRNINETESDVQSAAGRKAGPALGMLITLVVAWATLP